MANVIRGNKIFIDTTGTITEEVTLVAYILFTPDAANDELALRETVSDANCFYVRAATAKDTQVYDMSRRPIVFNNGIHVQALTAGAKVVLVTTRSKT